ncbi:hypothetical protein BpHYR1_053592, partial [Brachionus plicatilis]
VFAEPGIRLHKICTIFIFTFCTVIFVLKFHIANKNKKRSKKLKKELEEEEDDHESLLKAN